MKHWLLGLGDLRTDALKEERHRCVQCGGSTHQHGHGDPVSPTLIFLDLLKTDADDFAQLPLAQAEQLASGTQTTPDDNVHLVTTAFVFAPAGLGSAVADR